MPPRHECHACCGPWAGILAFQSEADDTRGTRVEQVVSSFQKILKGSSLARYIFLARAVYWRAYIVDVVNRIALIACRLLWRKRIRDWLFPPETNEAL